MSVQQEITRIQTARNAIRTKEVALGIGTSTDDITTLAANLTAVADRGTPDAEVQEGDTYTIQAGYYHGGTVKGVAGGGHYTLQAKTATPTKSQQSVGPDSGYYGLSTVTVNAIPDAYQDVTNVTATAPDVLATKVFVNSSGTVVTGTMTNNGTVSATLNTTDTSYTVPQGYHSGSGTVSITTEEKSTTPTTAIQNIVPSTGKVLSKVVVNPIPSQYADATNKTAVASGLLSGQTAITWDGENSIPLHITGSMTNNGAVTETLDTETTSYTIPQGYHNGLGSVSITTETKTTTPTTSSQSITPSEGNVLSSVTVNPIPSKYADATGKTATASMILEDETAISWENGSPIHLTGTMTNNGTVSQTLDVTTTSYTVPQGYHSGSGNVNIVTEEKTTTPTTSTQNITPTSGKVLKKVTVNPIPSNYADATNKTAIAANILSGQTAISWADNAPVNLTGTMTNNGAIDVTLDTTTTSYTVPIGYHNGSGTVDITLETKSTTPTTSAQTITPTAGKVLSSVSVGAIPTKYADATGKTAIASHLLVGDTAISWDAENTLPISITGTMADNGDVSGTLTGLGAVAGDTYVDIPAGYTSGGRVSITNAIETALHNI